MPDLISKADYLASRLWWKLWGVIWRLWVVAITGLMLWGLVAMIYQYWNSHDGWWIKLGVAYLIGGLVCLILLLHLLKNVARAITYGVALGLRDGRERNERRDAQNQRMKDLASVAFAVGGTNDRR